MAVIGVLLGLGATVNSTHIEPSIEAFAAANCAWNESTEKYDATGNYHAYVRDADATDLEGFYMEAYGEGTVVEQDQDQASNLPFFGSTYSVEVQDSGAESWERERRGQEVHTMSWAKLSYTDGTAGTQVSGTMQEATASDSSICGEEEPTDDCESALIYCGGPTDEGGVGCTIDNDVQGIETLTGKYYYSSAGDSSGNQFFWQPDSFKEMPIYAFETDMMLRTDLSQLTTTMQLPLDAHPHGMLSFHFARTTNDGHVVTYTCDVVRDHSFAHHIIPAVQGT